MDVNPHQRLSRRSLDFHRLIADRVRKQPALMEIAWANLAHWRRTSPTRASYLAEWEGILARGMQHALSIATEQSENADRLRQSTPFAGLISPRERWEFLRLWNDRNSST